MTHGAPLVFVASLHERGAALMKIRSLIYLAVLAFLYSVPDAAFTASAAPVKVVITPASFTEREGMLVVAHHQGFFRKHNLDTQLVLMPNAPLALSVLTTGDSQFYYGTTSGASLGAVLNGDSTAFSSPRSSKDWWAPSP